MNQITLMEMIEQAEAAKQEYYALLESGLFFEWYPQLTGDYDKDEIAWAAIYELVLKLRDHLEEDSSNWE